MNLKKGDIVLFKITGFIEGKGKVIHIWGDSAVTVRIFGHSDPDANGREPRLGFHEITKKINL